MRREDPACATIARYAIAICAEISGYAVISAEARKHFKRHRAMHEIRGKWERRHRLSSRTSLNRIHRVPQAMARFLPWRFTARVRHAIFLLARAALHSAIHTT